MGGFARDGVAAVAAYGEGGWDFYGAIGGFGDDAGDSAVRILKEASGLPAHAKSEAREARGFLCEEVEEVPLGHEGDEFGVSGEVREIGHGVGAIAEKAGEADKFGVRGG